MLSICLRSELFNRDILSVIKSSYLSSGSYEQRAGADLQLSLKVSGMQPSHASQDAAKEQRARCGKPQMHDGKRSLA